MVFTTKIRNMKESVSSKKVAGTVASSGVGGESAESSSLKNRGNRAKRSGEEQARVDASHENNSSGCSPIAFGVQAFVTCSERRKLRGTLTPNILSILGEKLILLEHNLTVQVHCCNFLYLSDSAWRN